MKLVKEEEKSVKKEEERGERRWLVVALLLFLLLSGLATTAFLLSCEVGEDTKDRWVKEVEGYPTWEELVDQIKEAEQSDSKLVKVEVIGRCVVHCLTVMLRQTTVFFIRLVHFIRRITRLSQYGQPNLKYFVGITN